MKRKILWYDMRCVLTFTIDPIPPRKHFSTVLPSYIVMVPYSRFDEVGRRSNGCNLINLCYPCAQTICKRPRTLCTRNLRDRPSEDRVGQLGRRQETSRREGTCRDTVSILHLNLSYYLTPADGLCSRTYTSIDPAPPTSGLLSGKPAPEVVSEESVIDLKAKLLDTKLPLFERYRAMFALRNIGTPSAVDALASGFTDDSALFKCVPLSSIFST